MRIEDVFEYDDVRIIKFENKRYIYAYNDQWQEKHRALIGLIRDNGIVETLIYINVAVVEPVICNPDIQIPRVARIRWWRDSVSIVGSGTNAGCLATYHGHITLKTDVAEAIANAPWSNIPPSSFPLPAIVMKKLLSEYAKWIMEKDVRIYNQPRILWRSKWNVIENPLWIVARAFELADQLDYIA